LITDPREHDIPDVGVVTFEDPESGRQILVDTGSAALRARFQDAAMISGRRCETISCVPVPPSPS